MVGISATLSFPANGSALLRARATISSPSLSMRRARATTCFPTSVSCTFFGRRSTSLTPRYFSSFIFPIDAVYQNHRNYQLLQWAPGWYLGSLNQNLPEDPSHVPDQY